MVTMPMFPYDTALIAVVQTAPQSIAEVLQVLRTIDATCSDADGLKWFNRLYMQVTEAVQNRVTAGGFNNPPWLRQLDVQFGQLFFNALRAALQGSPCPSCWAASFAVRNNTDLARIQFALAGVNAHINHDLPEALVSTAQITACVPAHDTVEHQDYVALNTTLDALIEQAKTTLNVRLMGDPMPAASHIEDTIAAWGVSAARAQAWNNSEILWHLRSSPPLAAAFVESLDGLTTVVSKTLLVPVP